MAIRELSVGPISLAGLLASALVVFPSASWAGDKHRTGVVYFAQTAPAMTYSAPVATYAAPAPVYSAPAPVYSAPAVYSAPYAAPVGYPTMAASTYSAPAPVAYSAPAPVTYSAPAPVAYSAPSATVGNAPTGAAAGLRIKAVDRKDIVEELRAESKEGKGDGTARERRKALRESAQTKYAEAIDIEPTELNEAEDQDIEAIVTWLIDGGDGRNGAPSQTVATAPWGQPYPTVYTPMQAPIVYQQAPTMLVQPMMPVQFLVPIQPKHGLFHR